MLKRLERKVWSRKERFLILSVMPVYFMIAGLVIQPLDTIIPGLMTLIREPDFLITDYFVVGGVGAALINAGLLTLASIWIIYGLGMEMNGHTITSSFLMFGFSLFGKNLLNIWTILLGVWIYAHYHKAPVSKYIYVGLYGTSLSPIITEMMQIEALPAFFRIVVSLVLGIVIGFVLPPLSAHTSTVHKGYSLYNVGFAGGIIATVIVSVMKSFGLEVRTRLIWYSGGNRLFLLLLSLLFLTMIVSALAMGKKSIWTAYVGILKTTGIGGTDYLTEKGILPTMFNMGINGLFAAILVVLVGGELNGPTIGGIMTIVGFSATGKHLCNILPIMFGVLLAGEAKLWEVTDPSSLLALLFSTTLAPIAGAFGVLIGILAGFLHSSVAIHVGIVYGGMNLYNNGFAGGLVAIFMVPVIQSVSNRKKSL